MNLDVPKWEEFIVKKLFKKPRIKKYSAIPETVGKTPFVSSSSENNGVSQLCDEMPDVARCITVSTNGNCFDCFYHDEPICVSNDVEVLVNDRLSEYQMLFLCSVLKQESYKYNYGRKAKNGKVWSTVLKLPVQHNSDGSPLIDNTFKYSEQGYVPDWDFMENYIKALHHKPLTTKRANVRKLDVNVSEWEEFCVEDLFDKMYKGKAYTDEDLDGVLGTDVVPYITRTDLNNGCKYLAAISDDFCVEPGNAISIGDTTATCFYQKDRFITGDHMVVLRAKWLNLIRGLFVVGLFNMERLKYSYGRAYKIDNIKKTIFKLPIQRDCNGNPIIDKVRMYNKNGYIPDWQFMEDYINSLPYSDRLFI